MSKGTKKEDSGNRVTLDSVAELAGVSPATVSRSLRNDPRISEATKKTVLKAARTLNYVPNLSARELAGKDSMSIGMIVSSSSDPEISMPLLQGADKVAYEMGHVLIATFSHADLRREVELVNYLVGKNVKGLIAYPQVSKTFESNCELFAALSARLPIVFVDHYLEECDCSHVTTDNVSSMYEATKLLLDKGHRDIAFVGSNRYSVGKERYAGYCKALQDYKVPLREDIVGLGFTHLDFEDAYTETLESFFASERPPTALVSWSMYGVFALCNLASEGKLNSLTGIDVVGVDMDSMPHVDRRIIADVYTVIQPHYEMGRQACQLLFDVIENPRAQGESVKLKADVVLVDEIGRLSIT